MIVYYCDMCGDRIRDKKTEYEVRITPIEKTVQNRMDSFLFCEKCRDWLCEAIICHKAAPVRNGDPGYNGERMFQ